MRAGEVAMIVWTRRRIEMTVAVVLAVAGLGLLTLPKQWIEGEGGGGDNGGGGFELLIALVPLVVGVALLAHLAITARQVQRRARLTTHLPRR
jgi:hypothetical protein